MKRSLWLLVASVAILGIGLAQAAPPITSETLQLRLNEENGMVALYAPGQETALVKDLALGTVWLPGEDSPRALAKSGFPGMQTEALPNRLNLTLPYGDGGKSFFLSLALEGDTLYTAFADQPVQALWVQEDRLPQGPETLALMQAPPLFREVCILPGLVALNAGEEGHLVLPHYEGSLVNFASGLKENRDFALFENAGFTMPFWGVCRPENTVFCLVDYLYTRVRYEAQPERLHLSPLFQNDPYHHPIRMQFRFLGQGKGYLDLAKTYRDYLAERGELPSLVEKLKQKPQLIHLLEGANIKFPIYMKHEQRPDAEGRTPPAHVYNYQRFEDVVAWLDGMPEVDRLMAVWWGWGKEGYDRLHPDFLPPNPELGGEQVFVEMTQKIKAKGLSVGFHDNYTDIYEAAPSYEDGAHCTVGSNGNPLRGGFWAGGQCWLLCSTPGLQFAQRNFAQMKDYGLDACFIDVLTAAPLFDCYSPEHPHSKWGDMKNKRAMMELAARYFGVFGTEHGFSWGADLCDYFEGITVMPDARESWQASFGTSIPLFAAIYHDAIVQYPHQGGTVHPSRPLRFLRNLRAGGACYYNVVGKEMNDPTWRRYFKLTYRVSSNTIQRTWRTVLTDHAFLNPEKTVEVCRYGQHILIVINQSDQECEVEVGQDILGTRVQTSLVLAPHGFLVATPDYAALQGRRWGTIEMEAHGWYEMTPVREEASSQSIRFDQAREYQVRPITEEN